MSSFIYSDKDLLNKLIRQGQIATDPQAYNQQLTQLHQLINNLEAKINNANTSGLEVSHDSDANDVPLKTSDLNSLESLIAFLAVNKITVNGQRIAYPTQEASTINDNENYAPLQFGNQQFYTDKTLLSSYLVSLQAALQKHPSGLVSSLLNARIAEANKQLDTNVNQKYTAPKTNQPNNQASQSSNNTNQSTNNVNSDQLLQEIVESMPFNSQVINLDNIKEFADKYAQLASNNSRITSLATKIDTEIQQAYSYMSSQSPIIQMSNLTVPQFKMWAKTPAHAQSLALILYSIINDAGLLYQQFISQNLKHIEDQPNLKDYARAVQQQVIDGGPQISNRDNLNELIGNLKQNWNQGYKQ